MMYRMRKFGVPALASGLMLTGIATAQVETRPAPVTAQDRPAAGDNTAVLTDSDRTQADGEVVRRVGEVLSGEVRGQGDEGRIAAISDLIMDAEGKPHYVLLSRGGVAGIGGDKIAVPFGVGQLSYVENSGWHLQLSMTGDQLQQAPTLEEGSLAQLRDQNWLQSNRQFFQADQAGGETGTGDDSLLFRASALKGAQVQGSAGDDSIAGVDDLLLGPDYHVTYAILGYGGVAGLGKNQIPVPFSKLRLTSEAENDRYRLIVGIDATKERLQSDTAPRLDGEYNRMLDPTFIDRVESYFSGEGATGTPGVTGTTGTTGTVGDTGTTGTVEPRPQP